MQRESEINSWQTAVCTVLVGAFLGIGWATDNWMAQNADKDFRDELFHHAGTLAQTINSERIKNLHFTPADQTTPEFKRLSEQLALYRAYWDCQSVHILAYSDNRIQPGPAACDACDSSQGSGDRFESAAPQIAALFQTGQPFIHRLSTGSQTGRVLVVAPIHDPRGGQVLAAVALEMADGPWRRAVSGQQRFVWICVLILVLMVLAGIAMLWHRNRPAAGRSSWRRHAETMLVATLGLTLTAMAVFAVHHGKHRAQYASFKRLTDSQAALVRTAFHNVRDYQLESLSRFIEGSQVVTREEFKIFTEPMLRQNGIQVAMWIPELTVNQIGPLEREAAGAGLAGFQVWQYGAGGLPEPAANRERFYPYWFFEPMKEVVKLAAEGRATLGFDAGSDPVRRAALESARAHGLVTATDLVMPLLPGKTSQVAFAIYKPVYARRGTPDQTLRGFAAVGMRPNDLLHDLVPSGQNGQKATVVHLFQLHSDPAGGHSLSAITPGTAARIAEPDDAHRNSIPIRYPILAFGKNYVLAFEPGPVLLRMATTRPEWTAGLIGCLLTATLSAFIHTLVRHQAGLENLVQLRTAALAASEEQHRAILQTAMDGFLLLDDQGRLLTANATYGRMSGYSTEELKSLCIADLDAAESTGETAAQIRTIVEQGEYRFETRHRRKDGAVCEVEVSAQYRPGTGQIVAFIRDIGERKRQELEIQHKNEEITRFLYTASHDLKSPLITIKAFLSYIEEHARNGDLEAMENDMGFVRNAADKMGKLLDELLTLSRIGRKVNPPEEIALQVVARSAADLVAGRIIQRGAQVAIDDQPVTLFGDVQRLVELYQNLIDNAIKFMGDQPAPRIEIGARRDKNGIVLFVRDNGSGIDPRYQAKLFGLFEKLQTDTEGVGMGLAIVKRIVEVHGGTIRVESAGTGQGATFLFTLARTRWGN